MDWSTIFSSSQFLLGSYSTVPKKFQNPRKVLFPARTTLAYPIVIGGHVDDMNLALVIQLAHLVELAIDVP